MPQQEDWYAYLRLSPEATTEQIAQAVERLSRQATALAVTAPERSQLLRETVRSIKRDLLSGPESKQRYDAGLAAGPPEAAPPAQPFAPPAPPPPAQPIASSEPKAPASAPAAPAPPPPAWPAPGVPLQAPPAPAPAQAAPLPVAPAPAFTGEGFGSRLARFMRTGWTCSACGKNALPSDKFCTKCGSPIKPVQPDPAPARARLNCANCAGPLAARDAFCPRCGTRVTT